jgi:hypothetical protein
MSMALKKKRPNSVLGLTLDGGRLEGAVLRRTNGSAEVVNRFAVDLNLSPLSAEPELAAQEIRGHLDKAEVRERNCVVCLPLNWAMALQTRLPELPEADLAEFLQIEAERGFSVSPEAMSIVSTRYSLGPGESYATQVMIPNDPLLKLEAVLRRARLVPLAFSLGLPILEQGSSLSTEGMVSLEVGHVSVGLQVNTRHGLVALRTLDQVLEDVDGRQHFNVPALYRELRITLGQMQPEIRASIRKLRVYGASTALDTAYGELKTRASALGLDVERVTAVAPDGGVKLPPQTPVQSATVLAAKFLSGLVITPDFLPPKVSAWTRLTAKYSAKKLVYAAGAVVVAALVVLGLFTVQQLELRELGTQWNSMSRKVRDLEEIQQDIKRFRPWFDESVRSLSILKRLTEAFPEENSVTAKTLEIRDSSLVTCTGTADSRQALYKTLDHLRSAPQVSEIKVDQEKGASPVQFSFNFQWGEKNQP